MHRKYPFRKQTDPYTRREKFQMRMYSPLRRTEMNKETEFNMYTTPQPVSAYLDRPLKCSCGRTHYVPIKAVEIKPGAIEEAPKLIKQMGYTAPFILCDPITYKIAGARLEALLKDAEISCVVHILTHLSFDEATLGEIVVSIPKQTDLMIGVGTGSITDMTRFSSFKLDLPCFTVATGAPMDGFAASIGILNVNNIKKTMPAHCTEAIIGDTDILSTAPYRMTVAGFGDLIGKLTCLNDWELARIIYQEHYCGKIVELVRSCVYDVMTKAEKIRMKDPSALGDVMNGLVLSGAAISLYGDSRPGSGAEHHMSHYWEAIKDQTGEKAAMHGEQVAVGTVLVLMLAEQIKGLTPDFEKARKAWQAFDEAAWEDEIRQAYGAAAQEVINTAKADGRNDIPLRLDRIDKIEQHWAEIKAQLETLPSSETLRSMLKNIGCPCTPEDALVDRALVKNALLYCKETRVRYTIFRMADDLAMLDELTEDILKRIYD